MNFIQKITKRLKSIEENTKNKQNTTLDIPVENMTPFDAEIEQYERDMMSFQQDYLPKGYE